MSEERYKLHPITIFLNFLKGAKELILPFAFIFGVNLFTGDGFSLDWQTMIPLAIAAVVLVFPLITGFIKWKRFVYWFEEGELRIEYGLFVKKKRYIPFERIQSLNYIEGIFHRPFGLVKVKVETAGSGKEGEAEAELTAIPRADADRIAEKIEEAKSGGAILVEPLLTEEGETVPQQAPPVKVEAVTKYRMSNKDLVVLATTSGGIGVVISAVALFLSQFADLIPYEKIYDEVMVFLKFGYMFIALVIFLGLLLAWGISVLMTFLANYQFTIQTDEDHIYITRGLLEKKKITVPFNRIQGINITQNPLRQLFNYGVVTVESAGGGGSDKDEKIKLLPLVKKPEMLAILTDLFPEMEWQAELVKAPKRGLHFYYRLDFIWMVPLIGGLSYFLFPYGLFSLLVLPLILALSVWQHRTVGYALTGKQLTMQFRTFSKHTYFLLRKRVQAVEVTQSIFQRRKSLASIQATIMSGMLGMTARINHMEVEDAGKILAWYEPSNNSQTIETTEKGSPEISG
ncbi:PH domain-containing protein [Planomicrobium sp. YIM 101495]|uniref:PH domain-containing protein n=1 Tax=Planomicrobium sp. YIM 101495 TaxID=2665160 RepID=UPI0012B72E66|nr:PH domain-containing protein [Planomicrobium sp. YIM 101495]MTD31581.1 PH domain-containing protein [Planomicrobium sp. YIM 101495]